MNIYIERLISIFWKWFNAFLPGLLFAYLMELWLKEEIATGQIFYDAIIFFVIGKVLIVLGKIIIDPLSFLLGAEKSSSDALKERVYHLKYIFRSATGVFGALALCWIGINIFDLFNLNNESWPYLALAILGLLISIIVFIAKVPKR